MFPRFLVIAVTVASMLSASSAAAATQPPSRHDPGVVHGRYIVVYDDAVTRPAAQTDRLERARGFRTQARYSNAVRGFAARLTGPQVAALESDPAVAAVVPDRAISAADALVVGGTNPSGSRRVGSGTTTTVRGQSAANVAVVDTGIDLDHPDLDVRAGKNCVGSGPPDDDNGHGTHVAGTIAARNDGRGITGVAPGTAVYAVKVLDSRGSGLWSQILCGLDWVASTRSDADPDNDIAVANLSLGGPGDPVSACATTTDPLHRGICRMIAVGITVVVAAGNNGWDFDYAGQPDVPAAYPEVLTVTAIADSDGVGGGAGATPSCDRYERDDAAATFSNFAGTEAGRDHVVAAPGVCVTSTYPGGGYGQMSGTSMAAPHVAGVVALCLGESGQAGPCAGMAPAEVVATIRRAAAERSSADLSYGFTGDPLRPANGRHYGYLTWAGLAPQPTAGSNMEPSEEVRPEPESDAVTKPDAAAPDPAPTSTLGRPAAVTVLKGRLMAGGAGALRTRDSSRLKVRSTSSRVRRAAWQVRIDEVPNDVTAMNVVVVGRHSGSCRQTVAIYRWSTRRWMRLDRRDVAASTETTVRVAPPAPEGLISGASGSGHVRLRVSCTSGGRAFTTATDVVRVRVTH